MDRQGTAYGIFLGEFTSTNLCMDYFWLFLLRASCISPCILQHYATCMCVEAIEQLKSCNNTYERHASFFYPVKESTIL